MKKNFILIVLLLVLPITILGQSKTYEGPDDPSGDRNYERIGYMSGNRAFIFFRNTTEQSNCCGKEYSKWPNDNTGLPMLDGIALLIGAKTFVAKDSIPDPWMTQSKLDTLYFIQTSYREGMDIDPTGTARWGFEPPKGYSNEASDYLAMSNIPKSWPVAGWPSTGTQVKWPGQWNGRFGMGKTYADLETFFVVNDAQDQEYLQKNKRVKYYPRPGIKIGDKDPNITRNFGAPWGGLGIRVETRGMQWSNTQTQDAIFWEYSISNISDYDIPNSVFGYWVDAGIGRNEEYDELGYFDSYLDMAFAWDIDMVTVGGQVPGIFGIAFLESPGNSTDGLDNDEDGIIDEKRDNKAVTFYKDPNQGIADITRFTRAHGEPKPHWDADEDQDWRDGLDANGNGKYDLGEFAGDDVGLDGLGPLDLNYPGPDPDGSECNHKPDYKEGLGCEPNFAMTDLGESDMIGLTTFRLFPVPQQEGPWPRNDEVLYHTMTTGVLEPYNFTRSNLVMMFASGTFPLYKGRTEHISMANIYSYDYIAYGNNKPVVPQLARKKEIVQIIYERDYRFATPPVMPTLNATAADGKVILSWNDASIKYTTEPLLNNVNDFEGFKLYKATDKYFTDAQLITNGFGEPTLKKPVFQCDLIDGKKGFADFGLVDGIAFNLGSDSGIEQYYVDHEVKNGVTYYYALVAYDYGIKDVGEGITPYENSVVIDVDEYGGIRNKGINVAIVTPTQKAAGYIPPAINIDSGLDVSGMINSNPVSISVEAPNSIIPGRKYKIDFLSSEVGSLNIGSRRSEYDKRFVTSGFKITDMYDGQTVKFIEDTTLQNRLRNNMVLSNENLWANACLHYPVDKRVNSKIVDGVQVSFTPEVLVPSVAADRSGWITGNSKIKVYSSKAESAYFPWDYDVVFTDNPQAYKSQNNFKRNIVSPNGTRLLESDVLNDFSVNFYVVNKSFKDKNGDYVKLDLVAYDRDHDGKFSYDKDELMIGHSVLDTLNNYVRWGGTVLGIDFANVAQSDYPKNGDVYRISFNRPLCEKDSIIFTVKEAQNVVKEKLNADMRDIKVVPNPYIATNQMEPYMAIQGMNQQRRILFTNLPASCIIKIFTMSGVLVREINVENPAEKGSAHWDLLTKENLEAAAGVYIFNVKSNVTGEEKTGKFAILK